MWPSTTLYSNPLIWRSLLCVTTQPNQTLFIRNLNSNATEGKVKSSRHFACPNVRCTQDVGSNKKKKRRAKQHYVRIPQIENVIILFPFEHLAILWGWYSTASQGFELIPHKLFANTTNSSQSENTQRLRQWSVSTCFFEYFQLS